MQTDRRTDGKTDGRTDRHHTCLLLPSPELAMKLDGTNWLLSMAFGLKGYIPVAVNASWTERNGKYFIQSQVT
ncbi:MAG: hypothetical protein ABW185_05070 [Sedimenticola sp.]